MAYRLKYTDSSEFTGMLVNTIKVWASQEPDLEIIASDGVHIKTQRIILAFYSPSTASCPPASQWRRAQSSCRSGH